jgi:hypothetical protein
MQALKDALAKVTRALPASNTNVTSTSIDTGKTTALGTVPDNLELLLSAPALTTGQLADAATMKYDILHSDNADMSSPSTYITAAITQTGAGGAGAAAATFNVRPPSTGKRYWGVKVTNSANADASGSSATLEAIL